MNSDKQIKYTASGAPLYRSTKERITIHGLDYYTLFNTVLSTTMDEKAFCEN